MYRCLLTNGGKRKQCFPNRCYSKVVAAQEGDFPDALSSSAKVSSWLSYQAPKTTTSKMDHDQCNLCCLCNDLVHVGPPVINSIYSSTTVAH